MPQQADPTRLVNVTVLFADLMDSVTISAMLDFWGYDELLVEYQKHLIKACNETGDYPIAETNVAGDQLVVFFYDPAEVEHNRELAGLPADSAEAAAVRKAISDVSDQSLFGAVRMAILLKNSWLTAPINMARVAAHQLPFDMGIGIHSGLCVLRERAGGDTRIEGYNINFAKRIEGYSRRGNITRVMLSRTATQRLRFVRRRQVVMRQRLGFIPHDPAAGELKGLQPGLQLFELKFFHRLGILPPEEQVGIFEELLRNDPKNVWAYQIAVEHFAYRVKDLDRAMELALLTREARPESEKVHYDLATIARDMQELKRARFYAERALCLNPDWDLIYGLLSDIEEGAGADAKTILSYRIKSYALCPDSAQNCWDLGEAYLAVGDRDSAKPMLKRALELWPGYKERDLNRSVLEELNLLSES